MLKRVLYSGLSVICVFGVAATQNLKRQEIKEADVCRCHEVVITYIAGIALESAAKGHAPKAFLPPLDRLSETLHDGCEEEPNETMKTVFKDLVQRVVTLREEKKFKFNFEEHAL